MISTGQNLNQYRTKPEKRTEHVKIANAWHDGGLLPVAFSKCSAHSVTSLCARASTILFPRS
eukprot:498864-Rhodomonas_salina.4